MRQRKNGVLSIAHDNQNKNQPFIKHRKSMKFTQDMMLQSDSGYCMPFEEKGKDVEMSLGYGKQKHPKTGEMFFHH